MFLHENEKCPVCDKFFTADDDIVICPRCGTPHHRACYEQLGHCFNSGRHAQGFSYEPPAKSSADDELKGEYYDSDDSKTHCGVCGAEIKKNAPLCPRCGARQEAADFTNNAQPNFGFDIGYEDFGKSEEIDGKKAEDAAAVVRTNVNRFIPKFIKNKKVSWNWGGFFFGPYYLFFRKIYKPAVIMLSLSFIVTLVLNGIFVKEIDAFYDAFSKAASEYVQEQGTLELSSGNMSALNSAAQALMPMTVAVSAVNLLISLFTGLFADRLYRSRVISIIDKADKRIEKDEGILDNAFLRQQGGVYSRRQMRQMYLAGLGGTSLMAPVAAYFALQLILSVISRL